MISLQDGQMPIDAEKAAELQAELDATVEKVLTNIAMELEKKKNEAISYRLPFEREWAIDYHSFNGDHSHIRNTKTDNTDTKFDHEITNDNITRNLTLMFVARMSDILAPNDEASWDGEPSPVADGPLLNSTHVMPDGSEVNTADLIAEQQEIAKKKCERMKGYIKDVFAECKYNENVRDALMDIGIYGTGVMVGPIVKTIEKRAWVIEDGVARSVISSENVPSYEYEDLWNFYPMPCRSVAECEGFFRLRLMNRMQVQALQKQPGFDKKQLAKLLKTEPNIGSLQISQQALLNSRIDNSEAFKNKYAVWIWNGPVSKDCFSCIEPVVLDNDDLAELDDTVMGEVWFCNGLIIKASINPIEGDESLPLYVESYVRNPTSIFGLGVPYICRNDQIAVNQTWSMIMLNGAMSSSSQIGVLKSALIPANGSAQPYGSYRPKYWYFNDTITDINGAMSSFDIPNHLDSLIPLYEKAKENAETRAMLPLMAQGEPSAAHPTKGGTIALLNTHNIMQRSFAVRFDDNMTKPQVVSCYRYLMLNHPDPEAKGDFNFVGKGSTYLLVKDEEMQKLFQLSQISQQPAYVEKADHGKIFEAMVSSLSSNFKNFVKTDAMIEAEKKNNAPQEDPRVVVERMRIESDKLKMQHEMQIATMKVNADVMVAQKNLESSYLSAARAENIKLSEIDAKLNIAAGQEESKQFIATMNAQLKAHATEQSAKKVDAQISLERPFRI